MGKTQEWGAGDLFLVENVDHRYTLGQVLDRPKDALNSASCAFFDARVGTESEAQLVKAADYEPFAILFVTPDFLNTGRWHVVAKQRVAIPRHMFPYEALRSKRYVGAKVIGTANVEKFLDAFFGLRPWDDWYRPDYLDGLLLSPDKKPWGRLIYKDSLGPH